jgi:acyl carrier protein
VLGHERVGVHDNFFELGGSSLLLVEIESRLREALGREIPIVEMFRNPTIRGLAEALEPRKPEPAAAAEAPPVRIAAAAAEGNPLDRQKQALEDLKRRRTQQKRAGR